MFKKGTLINAESRLVVAREGLGMGSDSLMGIKFLSGTIKI